MYYSERYNTPMAAVTCEAILGVNPDNYPAEALAFGIYPLVETPEGYSSTHFVKEGDTYRAIPHEFSNEEREGVYRIKALGSAVREFVSDCIPDWDATTNYFTGTFVEYNGSLWQAASASTNVEPVTTYDEDGLPTDNPNWTFIR